MNLVVSVASEGGRKAMLETIMISICTSIITFLITTVLYDFIRQYRDLKCRTAYMLFYYANIYTNPIDSTKDDDRYTEASSSLRQIGCEWYSFLERKPKVLIGLIKNKDIEEIGKNLIGLSNSLSVPHSHLSGRIDIQREDNNWRVSKIRKVLHIRNI